MAIWRATLLSAGALLAMGVITSAYAVDTKAHVETNTTRGYRANPEPLSDADRTFIKNAVDKAAKPAAKVANSTTTFTPGAHVDQTVKLYQLPAAAVERVPSYHLYEYFRTAKGEIVIVNPDTRVVVQTIGG
ncbi:MAG TPA: hypothetical protein VHD15_00855 [Hyphomicrobiales bacterium]|nr:hypothetical protein [Hyphomicrobiales bacterium]